MLVPKNKTKTQIKKTTAQKIDKNKQNKKKRMIRETK